MYKTRFADASSYHRLSLCETQCGPNPRSVAVLAKGIFPLGRIDRPLIQVAHRQSLLVERVPQAPQTLGGALGETSFLAAALVGGPQVGA